MGVLEGKKYIVTGGARGIGLAFCQAIVEAGGEVGILDILPEPHPDCAGLVQDGKCKYYTCDITQQTSLELAFINAIRELGGRLDGWCVKIPKVTVGMVLTANSVTCAGIGTDKPFTEITWKEFERVIAVNQTGTFFAVQLAVQQMLSQRQQGDARVGSVVMVASRSASGDCPGHLLTAYGGSKGFVKSFAMQLAHEIAATGIRVNSLSPGYVETDLNLNLAKIRPEVAHYFKEAPPMKRIGQPKDLTGGLVYLLSDAAAYVTGIDLAIDGGMSTGNGLTR